MICWKLNAFSGGFWSVNVIAFFADRLGEQGVRQRFGLWGCTGQEPISIWADNIHPLDLSR